MDFVITKGIVTARPFAFVRRSGESLTGVIFMESALGGPSGHVAFGHVFRDFAGAEFATGAGDDQEHLDSGGGLLGELEVVFVARPAVNMGWC